MAKRLDDGCLAPSFNISIISESSQYLFMTQILAPGLKFLGSFADLLTKPRQVFLEAVGIEGR